MSIKVMNWVWENSQARRGARLLLLAIADNANDAGEAWPSYSTLQRKTKFSRESISNGLEALVKLGELEIDEKRKGKRGQNFYRVLMGADSTQPTSQETRPVKKADQSGSPTRSGQVTRPDLVKKADYITTTKPTSNHQGGAGDRRARDRPAANGDGLHPLPDDFALTDAMRRWSVQTFGPAIDVDHETKQFVSHFRAEGTRKKSWPDAWQKWMRRAAQYASERQQRSHLRAVGGMTPEERGIF